MNSKSEFNRCKIPRLTVDFDGWTKKKAEEIFQKDGKPENQEQARDDFANMVEEAEESLAV